MLWRNIRLEQEEHLSKLATKSKDSLGRVLFEEPCVLRCDFERDANRILYSEDFRRLRHKTQVFFNAKNDHICTRMEHVLYVNSISNSICRTLNLNQDLVSAIALGHDIGHAPFGHSGEKALSLCLNKVNSELTFKHEYHSLRVADRLSKRISNEKIHNRCGLNLTYEVRDGIVSHCGENYSEYDLQADKSKKPEDIYTTEHRLVMPYTLEACLVRLVDKIAYVGRDIEDAIRAKLISYDDINIETRNVLGRTNGEMINTLVYDVVENSYDTDHIRLSLEKGQALKEMILQNNEMIYQSNLIRHYEKNTMNTVEGLFTSLYTELTNMWESFPWQSDGTIGYFRSVDYSDNKVVRSFLNYLIDKGYTKDELPERVVTDYIAGMTDAYALQSYEDLYWI